MSDDNMIEEANKSSFDNWSHSPLVKFLISQAPANPDVINVLITAAFRAGFGDGIKFVIVKCLEEKAAKKEPQPQESSKKEPQVSPFLTHY